MSKKKIVKKTSTSDQEDTTEKNDVEFEEKDDTVLYEDIESSELEKDTEVVSTKRGVGGRYQSTSAGVRIKVQ